MTVVGGSYTRLWSPGTLLGGHSAASISFLPSVYSWKIDRAHSCLVSSGLSGLMNQLIWGERSECFWWSDGTESPKGSNLGLSSERFCYPAEGQCWRVAGGTCLGLIFLVLISRILERFLDKRASLTVSGKAGSAFHFMLRQCKTKSLPDDCLIKE